MTYFTYDFISTFKGYFKKYWILLIFILIGAITIYPFLISFAEGFCYLDWCYYDVFNLGHLLRTISNHQATLLGVPIQVFFRFVSSFISPYLHIIIFLFIFMLGGFWFWKNYKQNDKLGLATLFGILLVFNPFIYERIMMGQWGVVASTILIPIFLYYMFKYFENPSRHNLIFLVIGFMASSIFQTHFFVINLALLFLYFILNAWKVRKDQKMLKSTSINFGKVLLVLFIINLYWFIPYIYMKLSASTIITDVIDYSHLQFFSSKPVTNENTLFLSSAMYGSWRESSMFLAKDHLYFPVFIIIIFVFIYLMIRGFLTNPSSLQNRFLLIIWIIGLIFAAGASHQWTSGIFNWFFENIPLFAGFRDANKFVALIVVSYVLLGAKGLKDLLKDKKPFITACLLIIILSMIIVYNYPQIGLHNQLHPISYPECYSNLNNKLNELPEDSKIIYLPWNIYITYKWSLPVGLDGRISNIINKVVDRYIITGVHPTDFGILTGEKAEIDKCIQTQNIDCLREKKVNYVILDKTPVFNTKAIYSWVSELTNVYEDECVIVYKTN